ncbi:glycoside hydrolase family 36 protein [Paenibacillus allorhizosphaerae]|uniref:Alpha-galactosidase n=1 Tax=Paenibacillus allorhizosphaerae TaxID=2849866 RepID=A0ABM8VCZ7_9BACL|nr:glycoside hydrolase family 36 protein [Paenibacillus allorhizosphaerae]CAG7624674.1 hypothetical protein PAECIP111802_01088 [Paenibacillus allorhizosphaerae]
MKTIHAARHPITISGDNEQFRSTVSAERVAEGLELVRIRIEAAQEAVPPVYSLRFIHPIADIHAFWQPAMNRNQSFKADWMRPLRSNAAASAPVITLYNVNGRNRLTFAFSDALNTIRYAAGVHEESAEFHCSVELFTEATAPLREYEATLLLDTRDLPYYECLEEVQRWWAAMPAYRPAPVPEPARRPMYSTWYSMHQNVTAQSIEEQCRIAAQLGMDAVIVDDGWQTADNRRGYAYCGDWEAYAGKFPDMKQHVAAVHRLGMKFILWYSVPFIGKYSNAWERFKDRILRFNENHGAGVLDPRYPEVREYIIGKYEQAVGEWDLDGFKLDFIDTFYSPDNQPADSREGMDYTSVPAAVDRLLTDVIGRLRSRKPDMMIEFRQSYIGPAMRKYGNMFRAGDCPNDSIQNRVRTLDIRLIAGNTAAHADMIMWNAQEPVESAALQLVNLLFSVPQVSVLLDRLPEAHRNMLRYWLAFWNEHRDVLLDGKLQPEHPELLYPVVRAYAGEKAILATYHDALLKLEPGQSAVTEWIIVNGRLQSGLYLETEAPLNDVTITIRDCVGETVETCRIHWNAGIHKLKVPPAGTVSLRIHG